MAIPSKTRFLWELEIPKLLLHIGIPPHASAKELALAILQGSEILKFTLNFSRVQSIL
jgi:hypothetical protein